MKKSHFAWFGLTASVLILFSLVAPYTKIEEAFNLHAVHDLLYVKSLNQYDHIESPGPVPRSFLGAMILASLTAPFTFLPKVTVMAVLRIILSLATAGSLSVVQSQVFERFGQNTGHFFGLLNIVQFHMMFWGSRTIPNTFGLILFNLAFASWINNKLKVAYLCFAAAVFRSELAVALALMMVFDLYKGKPLLKSIFEGLGGSFFAILSTVLVDSLFYNRLVFPEFESFVFNIIENKCIEWGIHPWHFYFTRLLPKIVPLSGPLCLLSIPFQKSHKFLYLIFAYVGVYSFVQHKEWRFIMYMIPVVNVCGAITLSVLVKRFTAARKLIGLAAMGMFTISCLMVYISSQNYPGGVALHTLRPAPPCSIHVDIYSSQSGATRFVEHPECSYSHFEMSDVSNFTHLITEKPYLHPNFTIIQQINGFSHIQSFIPIFRPLVYIMKNKQ